MTDHRILAIQYAHDQRARFLADLKEFSAIPSISTAPEHRQDVERAAEWLADHLRSLGMQNVSINPTAGHPVVYAEWLSAGSNATTVLIYGHYDVQPAEPLDLWQSEPFQPTIRGENLYGRGVSDMKAQVVACLDAVEAINHTGSMPVNIKFLFEGEEEIGSPNLGGFIKSHRDLLACDFAFNPDTGMLAADLPTITYALRGMAYFEIRVYGPDNDLHSGTFGGTIHNPAQVLCELVAGMHDEMGRVTLPGFYDSVRALEPEESAELSRLPMDEAFYKAQTGAPALWGEAGYSPAERTSARPTLEVNGLLSGYTGAGTKTVLPSHAMAKISMRLVPDQIPEQVHQQLISYMESHAPKTVKWEVIIFSGGPASISERNSKEVKAMSRALETVWRKRPLFKREGGSVPVVSDFKNSLGVETVNTGFGLYDDKAHSPNEKLHLPTWERGIDAVVHFFFNLVEE